MAVFFGVGSNLGDRWAYLSLAIDGLARLDRDLVVSPVYETAPVGGPSGQGRYLNCVVRLESSLEPHALLAVAQNLEAEAQRVRIERNGPRTLDIDILLIEGFASDDPQLTVPHPRLHERAFVLAPLADLDPDLVRGDWRTALGGEELVNLQVRRVGELVARRGTLLAGSKSAGQLAGG